MDRTLKRAKRSSKRRNHRNAGAWRRFSPDGTTCRFCEHDGSAHLCASAQPHFYRRATEEERGDPRVTLYRHDTPEGGSALVRRVVVANHAELITAFCTACAEEMQTSARCCATSAPSPPERWWGSGQTTRKETDHDDQPDHLLHLPKLR